MFNDLCMFYAFWFYFVLQFCCNFPWFVLFHCFFLHFRTWNLSPRPKGCWRSRYFCNLKSLTKLVSLLTTETSEMAAGITHILPDIVLIFEFWNFYIPISCPGSCKEKIVKTKCNSMILKWTSFYFNTYLLLSILNQLKYVMLF